MKRLEVWKEEKERGISNMKSLLKFITCGSVDDGKSTLIGHILYDAKLLYADQKRALELDSKVGSRGGAIDYSLLLDGLMAEREQGITIDVAYRYFTTDIRSFIVADTPGHEQYTRNMAVGASFADLSIILIDAKQGVLVQTRRHARICSLMGIRHFVFAVNKMDLIGYDEERFKHIERQIIELAAELALENTVIIPVSATQGDNVTAKSQNIAWYHGKALLSYLEEVEVESDVQEKGFYMPVQRVCRPDYTFRGFQGQIEAGRISVGDEITALPSSEKAVVKSILVADQQSPSAIKGQPVTIQLDREVDVSRGCVLANKAHIKTAKAFSAKVLWMDDSQLTEGKGYFIKLGTKQIPGVVTQIKYKVDVNTGEKLPTVVIGKNEIIECEITLTERIVLDTFKEHRTLGELILIDRISNMTSGCGVIEKVYEQDKHDEPVSFRYDVFSARGDVFEEFYYNTQTLSFSKHKSSSHTYTIGDEIPLKGDSYHYPEDFDILQLRDWVFVKIRNGKVTKVQSIDVYAYENNPVVNERGFRVRVETQEEVSAFLEEYKTFAQDNEAEFLNKWVVFETFRNVVFHSDFWVI